MSWLTPARRQSVQAELRRSMLAYRPWLMVAGMIVMAGMLIGILSALGWFPLNAFWESLENQAELITRRLLEMGYLERWLYLTGQKWMLLMTVLFGSILFGWFALGIAYTYGLVLGELFTQVVQSGQWAIFALGFGSYLWLEIPVLFLAMAGGLRLGLEWIMPRSAGKRLATINRASIECFVVLIGGGLLMALSSLVEAWVLY